MNRKIAAIMAADIAGYSKLVADDEEETVRRLSSYRAVFDDFIARASGRVFNTAGDAILAEFPSAVEAVRCAIDVQESLRTRNLAYPPSRQMHFRIGMTIGDVIEREGGLLGDGVNIAARLEGLAAPGGICISRSIYEQVANKLSVAFVDIGEQQVKNIPSPIHAYTLALGSGNAGGEKARAKKLAPRLMLGWTVTAPSAVIGVLGIAALLYLMVKPGSSPAPVAEQKSTAAAPTPERMLTATTPSGVKTLVGEHVAFGDSCVPQHVVVKVTTPPPNGEVIVTEENRILPEKTTLGGVQKCSGKSAPTAVLYYTSRPNYIGMDQFRYRRTNEDNPNDRLNGDIILTVVVKEERTAKAIEKYSLLGTFAWDCGKPPATSNRYFLHRMLEGDRLQREQMSGPATRDWVTIIDRIEQASSTELALRGMFTGHLRTRTGIREIENRPAFGTWRMESSRFKIWDSVVDNEKTVIDGHFTNGGAEVPWTNKCAPRDTR
jgi:class 3 adenylate cyclase